MQLQFFFSGVLKRRSVKRNCVLGNNDFFNVSFILRICAFFCMVFSIFLVLEHFFSIFFFF